MSIKRQWRDKSWWYKLFCKKKKSLICWINHLNLFPFINEPPSQTTDSQPAAVSVLDGSLKGRGHVAYLHGDALARMQLKGTPTDRQVVDLQTGREEGWRSMEKHYIMLLLWPHRCMCVTVCVHSLVQAVGDSSDQHQRLLSLHARILGVLEGRLDHLGGFLIHWYRNITLVDCVFSLDTSLQCVKCYMFTILQWSMSGPPVVMFYCTKLDFVKETASVSSVIDLMTFIIWIVETTQSNLSLNSSEFFTLQQTGQWAVNPNDPITSEHQPLFHYSGT